MTDEHRVALVTGGTGELGLAVARRLKADGLRVAVLDRPDPIAKAVAEHNDLIFVGADLAQPVEEVVRVYGGLDVLVNLVGHDRTTPEESWEGVLSAQLTSPFRLTQDAWPHLIQRGRGRLVTVVGAPMTGPLSAATLTAAHGLVGLTRALAGEGTGRATANLVQPSGPPEPGELAALVGYLVSEAAAGLTGARLELGTAAR